MYEVFPVPLGQFTSVTYPRLSEANGRETPHISAWTTWPETFWPRSKMRGLVIHCNSLRASQPGRSGGGEGKRRRAFNHVSGVWISASKSRCEMLIGGHDISNDLITPGMCFSMFLYIRARFRFALIGGNLTTRSTGSHSVTGGGIQIPQT